MRENSWLFKIVCGGQLLNLRGFVVFFSLLLSKSKNSFLFRKGKPILMTATKFCNLLGKTIQSSPALALFSLLGAEALALHCKLSIVSKSTTINKRKYPWGSFCRTDSNTGTVASATIVTSASRWSFVDAGNGSLWSSLAHAVLYHGADARRIWPPGLSLLPGVPVLTKGAPPALLLPAPWTHCSLPRHCWIKWTAASQRQLEGLPLLYLSTDPS